MNRTRLTISAIAVVLGLGAGGVSWAAPIGTAFTYQGQLKQGGLPVSDTADIKFTLYDDATTPPGSQIGSTLFFDSQAGPNHFPHVSVNNGLFTVTLDFGTGIFTGDARWLEIEVRVPHDPTDTLPYTTLSPRQELTPTPYALYAASPDGHSLDAMDGSPTDALYVDEYGNVGIGTAPPYYTTRLHVGAGENYARLWIGGTQATNGEEVGLLGFAGHTGSGADATYANIRGVIIDSGDAFTPCSGALVFHAADGQLHLPGEPLPEHMRIDWTGNVGIGTTSPSEKLVVGDGSSDDRIVVNGSSYASLQMQIGSNQWKWYHTTADNSLRLNYNNGTVRIVVANDGNVGIGETNPVRKLHVRDPIDTPLRVESSDPITGIELKDTGGTACIYGYSGNVGIGRTPTTNPFEVEGNASKTTAGDWLANSDGRIKTDVRTISNALKTLDNVRLVSFRYTDQYRADHPDIEDRPYMNVIAQEFQQVFPEYVRCSGDRLPDGTPILQVDPYPLTIYSAAAAKELRRIVSRQQEEISELRARLQIIEALLTESTNKENGGRP